MTDVAPAPEEQAPATAGDLPNGKTEMAEGDTLAFVMTDDNNIAELVYSDETGVYIRDNGAWTLTNSDDPDNPVWDQEWIDADPTFIPKYDELAQSSDAVSLENFVTVIAD